MIQIDKNNPILFSDLCDRYCKRYIKLNEKKIDKKIQSYIKKYGNIKIGKFYQKFALDWKILIQAKPKDLINFKENNYNKFNLLFKVKKNRKQLLDLLGYERVRKTKFVYEIVKDMGIKACPYCNAHPIHAYKTQTKSRLQTQLDHYFPKSIYPYLSVSFYNLIPICSYCNNRKGDQEFPPKFYHPYRDNVANKFRFRVVNNIKKLHLDKDYRQNLKIKVDDYTNTIPQFSKKMEIEELYDNYTDVAAEIFEKSKIYNKTKKLELQKLFKQVFNKKINDQDMNVLILGNFVEEKDILKRPISKFMQDIAKDVGLL